jgi:hypothetical protein
MHPVWVISPGPATTAWLVGAGVLAGAVGTAGGITSLVSYPALIATGLSPLHANVANLVAALACWPGSALTSRRELSRTWAGLRVGLVAAAIGGAVGAVALRMTPARAFTAVVPYLVLLGSVVVLIQPALARRLQPGSHGEHHGAPRDRGHAATVPAIGAVSVYGGYFGAGSGILLLATTLTLVDPRIPQANAAKNMLLGAGALTAGAVFVITAAVDWPQVIPLAMGLFVGGTLGPLLARRLPGWLVRLASASVGLVLAVSLFRG